MFFVEVGPVISVLIFIVLAGSILKYLFSEEGKQVWKQQQYNRRIHRAVQCAQRKSRQLTDEELAAFDLCSYAQELSQQYKIRLDSAMQAAKKGGLIAYKGWLIHDEVAPTLRQQPYSPFGDDDYARLASGYHLSKEDARYIVFQCNCIYQNYHKWSAGDPSEILGAEQIHRFVERALSRGELYPIWNWGLAEETGSAYRAAAALGMHPHHAFLMITETLRARGIPCR